MLISVEMILMFLRSQVRILSLLMLPAVNSVPASSAVERNSSNAFSWVMLRNFTQFGSLCVSVVCYRETHIL